MLYYIPWIHWIRRISYPFRENSIGLHTHMICETICGANLSTGRRNFLSKIQTRSLIGGAVGFSYWSVKNFPLNSPPPHQGQHLKLEFFMETFTLDLIFQKTLPPKNRTAHGDECGGPAVHHKVTVSCYNSDSITVSLVGPLTINQITRQCGLSEPIPDWRPFCLFCTGTIAPTFATLHKVRSKSKLNCVKII